MAYPLLQVYDEDTSTVLFDLNDDTGLNNAAYGSVRTWTLDEDFDLGSPDVQLSYNEPREAPGGTLVHQRHGLAEMTIRCSAKGTDMDNLRNAVGGLQKLLASGGVLKWQPDAAAEARYIDFLAVSDVPQLWRGQGEEVVSVFNSYADMEGLSINLVRQPYLRGTELDGWTNALSNATMLTDAGANGQPDDWSVIGTITSTSIDAATESAQFTCALTGSHGYWQTGIGSVGVGQTWTASADARVVSGAAGRFRVVIEALDAGLGTLASAQASTTSTSFQRLTATLTLPASTASIRVYLLADNTAATAATYQVRRAQVEQSASASLFHTGKETVRHDPAGINGRIYPVYVSGDAETPVRLYINQNTSEDMTGILIAVLASDGVTGRGKLADYMNSAKFRQLEAGTLGTDATTVVDANASPGSGTSAVNVSYATPTMATRVTTSFTGTVLTNPLRGKTFDVYVRVAHTVASTTSSLQMTAYYSEVTSNVNPVVSPAVSFVSSSTMANVYKDVKIGTVTLPEYDDIPAVNIAIGAARSSGTGALRLDALMLVPVDEAVSLIQVPSPYVIDLDEVILSDPELGFLDKLATTDRHRRAGLTLKGPQPVVLKPGLNLLYVASWGLSGTNVDVSLLPHAVFIVNRYKPRFYH